MHPQYNSVYEDPLVKKADEALKNKEEEINVKQRDLETRRKAMEPIQNEIMKMEMEAKSLRLKLNQAIAAADLRMKQQRKIETQEADRQRIENETRKTKDNISGR